MAHFVESPLPTQPQSQQPPPAVFDELSAEWQRFLLDFEFTHDDILRLMSTPPWPLDECIVAILATEIRVSYEDERWTELEQWLRVLIRSDLRPIAQAIKNTRLLVLGLKLAKATENDRGDGLATHRLARALVCLIAEMIDEMEESKT